MQLTEKGTEWDMHVLNGSEAMKSASFASTTKQRLAFALPQAENPGPGTYDPNFGSIETQPGHDISKVGRDTRFVGDSILKDNTTGHIGPGSYEPRVTNGGAPSTVEGWLEKKIDFGWSASFLSDHVRSLWTGWFPKGEGEPDGPQLTA